jgi:hypothetical protein
MVSSSAAWTASSQAPRAPVCGTQIEPGGRPPQKRPRTDSVSHRKPDDQLAKFDCFRLPETRCRKKLPCLAEYSLGRGRGRALARAAVPRRHRPSLARGSIDGFSLLRAANLTPNGAREWEPAHTPLSCDQQRNPRAMPRSPPKRRKNNDQGRERLMKLGFKD